MQIAVSASVCLLHKDAACISEFCAHTELKEVCCGYRKGNCKPVSDLMMLGSEEVIKMDAWLSCCYYHPSTPTKETLKRKALF